MNIESFGFYEVQNFRTLAMQAKRDGINDIEALLVRLDRYIVEQARKAALDGKVDEPTIGTPDYQIIKDHKERIKQDRKKTRRQIAYQRKSMAEKMRLSTPCPSCGKGRVVEDLRDGIVVRNCTYPKSSRGGMIKFESGCGWSEMVGA